MFEGVISLNGLSIVLLTLLAGFVGYYFGARKKNEHSSDDIHQRYLQGFNFLLNDQSDKALEVFIKALEVDSDTVELHLALGGLFRRQGQVSRATRVHQNIIARPDLSEGHHHQAIYELAKDYVMAGLHDRAENLFLELIENHVFLAESYVELMGIYELQQEWTKALKIANKSEASVSIAKRASHYHFELAEKACDEGNVALAKRHMKKAKYAFPGSSRFGLLSVKLSIQTGNMVKALNSYNDVIADSMNVRPLMQSALVDALLSSGEASLLSSFLSEEIVKRPGVCVLQTYLEQFNYERQACLDVVESVLSAGRVNLQVWLASQLSKFPSEISAVVHQRFGAQMLEADVSELEFVKYQCSECGFKSKVLNWSCPNCRFWESQEILLV
ncbi:MAG: hypothetical protein ACRBEE_13140 [Arenicella sp.]